MKDHLVPNSEKSTADLLQALNERAKELGCLYHVEEILNNRNLTPEQIFRQIIDVIPPGFQYPAMCLARIVYKKTSYQRPNFKKTTWCLSRNIIVQDVVVGSIEIYYTQEAPQSDEGPFLQEERKLVNTIADRIGYQLSHRELTAFFNEWQTLQDDFLKKRVTEWKAVLEMLRRTDQSLYTRISRKMLNFLCWHGIKEADKLLQRFNSQEEQGDEDLYFDSSKPQQREELYNYIKTSDEIFRIAEEHLSGEEILARIQRWIKDDKANFLLTTLENSSTSLAEIADAVGRYYHIFPDGLDLSRATAEVIRVSLIRRFFTEQLDFINIAKNYINIADFYDLLQRIIYHQRSHGKLGGKSSGLFLAEQILKRAPDESGLLQSIKVPKTWYIASDSILNFIHYNNLEEVFNQKYLHLELIREEYPHIVQIFKNSYFSPEIIKGLSMALDDLGDTPIIVRSSSLLEDNVSHAFSGKYKSLFLANTGTKAKRLEALMDAISEVYASLFGPDPIEYRSERGLLDYHEEMGIMIQQVVGAKVGKYFLPAFAGVAFSNNEFRWSPRIKREDGLIRLVPGLGTRAVDRVADDYPVLLAPGQPNLRVNATPEEMIRYAPKKIDLINLETNSFESMDLDTLLRECGDEYPLVQSIVSLYEFGHMRTPYGLIDFTKDDIAVTFSGLIENTSFVNQIHLVLQVLQRSLNTPVDIEFASDGKSLYLLQCRSQSFGTESVASPIPRDIPKDRLVFTASRYVSNGRLQDTTHIVYVDPGQYSELPDRADLVAVGRAIGRLNTLLPKRQFILMGPGRWGSRGDIKLGVNVSYSDINNTSLLVEIARKKGNYLPDLSFGTHFFQDLVEASIRYLPLYPDDEDSVFNEAFLTHATNILPKLLPEYAHLAHVIHVIDVPENTDGQVLRILMNADLDRAAAFLATPIQNAPQIDIISLSSSTAEDHWSWRNKMAERIAALLNSERFGVRAMYLIGSTKNATAGPNSDIDLVVHFQGTEEQKATLLCWFDGWSSCLAEMNYLRTGYATKDLLDVHFITDEDIRQQSSYAVKIDAVTDAARPLVLGK
jgi:pyruvate, water dikinase